MSLRTQSIPPIPDLTSKVAQRAFRKGNTYMHMRDVLGTFFTDDQFADLYPTDATRPRKLNRLSALSEK